MIKDDHGFTLMEAVTALALLSSFCLVFLPLYHQSMKEQKSVNEERTALFLLEKEALQLLDHSSGNITGKKEGIYEWSSQPQQSGTNLCLQWEGENDRPYKKCLFVLQ
ncbi:hypothetical protein [Salibacterium sp. K-3]